MYTGATPKPATTSPVMRPFFSGGNHFTPAGIIMIAKKAMAIVYGSVACVLVQPNPPFSMGSTSCFEKTLHAYRIPSARLSPIPASVTTQPVRFIDPLGSIVLAAPADVGAVGELGRVRRAPAAGLGTPGAAALAGAPDGRRAARRKRLRPLARKRWPRSVAPRSSPNASSSASRKC